MTMQNFFPGLEESEPRAAFLRGTRERIGSDPFASIYGRFQAQQQNPYQTTFGFNQLMNPPAAGTQTDNPFMSYAQANNLGGVRNQARDLFSQLGGATAPAQVAQQFQQPDEDQASSLRNLAVTALLSRISPLALGLLNLPSGGDLRDRFVSQTGGQPTNAAGQQNNFIDYVRNQLGLGLI